MQNDPNLDLLNEIKAFLADAGMSESYFGKRSVNNSELVGRLKAGGGVTVSTASKIRTYIANERHARNLVARRATADA